MENERPKLALANPIGTPITDAIDEIEMLPVVTDKTINDLLKYSKKQYIYQVFCSLVLFI